jgi:excisionase family DNA binding protein
MAENQRILTEMPVVDLLENIKQIVNSRKIEDGGDLDVLNKKEASKFIGVSVPTIDRLISKRGIPFKKIGSRVVFLKKELASWLHAR